MKATAVRPSQEIAGLACRLKSMLSMGFYCNKFGDSGGILKAVVRLFPTAGYMLPGTLPFSTVVRNICRGERLVFAKVFTKVKDHAGGWDGRAFLGHCIEIPLV